MRALAVVVTDIVDFFGAAVVGSVRGRWTWSCDCCYRYATETMGCDVRSRVSETAWFGAPPEAVESWGAMDGWAIGCVDAQCRMGWPGRCGRAEEAC